MTWWRQIKDKIRVTDAAERWLIVGLGNPGSKYEKSWHNLGYMALDRFAASADIKLGRLRFRGITGEGEVKGKKVILLKPLTYMNLSGQSVAEASKFYRIPPEKIVVLVDDIDLHVGVIRLRAQGSAGTHKGLKSIIAQLGSSDFNRIRIGMGPRPAGDLADIVLSNIPDKQKQAVDIALKDAVLAMELLLSSGIEAAQSVYN